MKLFYLLSCTASLFSFAEKMLVWGDFSPKVCWTQSRWDRLNDKLPFSFMFCTHAHTHSFTTLLGALKAQVYWTRTGIHNKTVQWHAFHHWLATSWWIYIKTEFTCIQVEKEKSQNIDWTLKLDGRKGVDSMRHKVQICVTVCAIQCAATWGWGSCQEVAQIYSKCL